MDVRWPAGRSRPGWTDCWPAGTPIRRTADWLSEKLGKSRYFSSEGAETSAKIWGNRAKWVALEGKKDDKSVGIAILNHPTSANYPTYWHARGYGLFAANPFGERDFYHDKTRDGSVTIPAGGTLILRYRVLIHSGDAREAEVAEAYQRYTAQR